MSKGKEQVNEWLRVGEDFSIFKFELEKPFIGVYIETKNIVPENAKKEPFDLHVFADYETGELHNLPDVHAVKKAIESVAFPTETLFKFDFKGLKDLGGKKTVNMIDAFTMLLSK